MSVIYLAGGCFWGVQKYFDQFDGVINTVVGYANGHTANPTYEEVKSQKSGHAETLKIDYDETKISLTDLLEALFVVIDPILSPFESIVLISILCFPDVNFVVSISKLY